MSDLSKNLSDEGAGAGESLNFTAEELLDELALLFGIEERRAGDLDLRQIQARLGVSRETVRTKMNVLVQQGKFELHWVLDGGKKKRIFRKKE